MWLSFKILERKSKPKGEVLRTLGIPEVGASPLGLRQNPQSPAARKAIGCLRAVSPAPREFGLESLVGKDAPALHLWRRRHGSLGALDVVFDFK